MTYLLVHFVHRVLPKGRIKTSGVGPSCVNGVGPSCVNGVGPSCVNGVRPSCVLLILPLGRTL
jgi:hypothetical protein